MRHRHIHKCLVLGESGSAYLILENFRQLVEFGKTTVPR